MPEQVRHDGLGLYFGERRFDRIADLFSGAVGLVAGDGEVAR
jgi:hypothetical protein